MIACYILYSPYFDRFYIGATQESVEIRLQKHNNKTYGTTASAYTNDWQIFLTIECSTYAQAINIERHIKKMKSKTYLLNLKKYPELISKLLLQYHSST